MAIRNLSRRLERLEDRHTPTSPEVIEVLIISSATGLVVDRILSTCDDDLRSRDWRTDRGSKKKSAIDYDNARHQVTKRLPTSKFVVRLALARRPGTSPAIRGVQARTFLGPRDGHADAGTVEGETAAEAHRQIGLHCV